MPRALRRRACQPFVHRERRIRGFEFGATPFDGRRLEAERGHHAIEQRAGRVDLLREQLMIAALKLE